MQPWGPGATGILGFMSVAITASAPSMAGMDPYRIDAGGGVVLRAPVPDDAPGVLSVHGDARVYEHDPHETQHDLADAERFLAPILSHWADHGFGYWTVLVDRDVWPAGVTSPLPDDRQKVHAGMGGVQRHTLQGVPVLNTYFRLAPAIHGRGIAGRIVRTALGLAPQVAPGVDVVVRTRPANLAARRVAEREGFTDVGLEAGTTDMQLLRRSSPAAVTLRVAREQDVVALASLWHEGWHEAHAGRVPDELLAHRTLEALIGRMREFVTSSDPAILSITAAHAAGRPVGFVVTHRDEVDQMYVHPQARGTGAAAALLTHGENHIRSCGHPTAWLAVVAGNDRARRFYERQGWHDAGPYDTWVWSTDDAVKIPVPVRRYEKPLEGAGLGRPG